MKEIIGQKLRELEAEQNIRILYACESGSRAWGFASPDSDFDVRFIYTRHIDDYLSLQDIKDVVELPVNEVLDIGGWDIRKALKLFLKSNSPLYEWLQSPIVYEQNDGFASALQALMPQYYSLRSGANHYLSMAFNTFTNDLQGEQVKMKRYFYALRPILACLWIIEKRSVPPMEFKYLRALITDASIQQSIDELMERKMVSDEKTMTDPVAVLNDWLGYTLHHCKNLIAELPSNKKDVAELNALFKKYVTK